VTGYSLKFKIFRVSCIETKFKQNDHIFIFPSAHFVVLGTSCAFVVTAFWSVLGAARKVIYVRIQRNNFFIARRGAKSINEIELFMGRIIGGHLIALLAFPNLLPPLFRTCAEHRPSVSLSLHPAAKIITRLVPALFESRLRLPTTLVSSCCCCLFNASMHAIELSTHAPK